MAIDPREKFVYFAQAVDGGPIKIGMSRQPSVRVGQVVCPQSRRGAHLLFVGRGSEFCESSLHDFFLRLAMGGEWFRCTPSVLMMGARFQRDPVGTIAAVNKANHAAGVAFAYERFLSGNHSPALDDPLLQSMPNLREIARFRVYSGTQWTTIPEAIALRAVMNGGRVRIAS